MSRKKNNEIRSPKEVRRQKRMTDGLRWAEQVTATLKKDQNKTDEKGN